MSFLSKAFLTSDTGDSALVAAPDVLTAGGIPTADVTAHASKLGRPETLETDEEFKEDEDAKLSRLESLETDGEGQAKAEGGEEPVTAPTPWEPSGNTLRDFFYFCGPGWFVSIAYIDPGNYQADIQAGATSRYTLLFALWWTSMLSIYVQILCVRLAYYGQVTLAEAQARDSSSRRSRYISWAIAEFSAMVTDLPEVIGIGIAMHQFFGWPYYAGVLLSLLTTMVFLMTMHMGAHILERIIIFFVGIMSMAQRSSTSPLGELYFLGVSLFLIE